MDEFNDKLNSQNSSAENNPDNEKDAINQDEISSDDYSQNQADQIPTGEYNFDNSNEKEQNESSAAQEADKPTDYAAMYNSINYTNVGQVTSYKPLSKGLKIFSIIIAALILLTSASVAGYFLGKNNVFVPKGKSSVNLAAKPSKTDELTAAQIYDKTNKSIVGIAAYNTAGNGSQASGVIYSKDGYIITNDHIYAEVPSAKFKIYTYDGKEYDAKFVAGDKVSDLAVLKVVSGSGFSPAEFGDSDQLINGEHVVAIGRPNDATNASCITQGIISATSRRVASQTSYSSRLIQTDSAINPGNSGGGLINMYGQVVGITSAKLAGVNYDAVGYAIPTTTMKKIVTELISKGKVVSRAKLGISYTAINSITAEINNYKEVGIYVASVTEDSDLYGKVEEGDIITHINGIKVTSDNIVLDIIEKSVAGDKIKVTVVKKKGGTKEFEAVLKANTSESSYTTKASTGNSSQSGSSDNSGNKQGGTFDFPFGE